MQKYTRATIFGLTALLPAWAFADEAAPASLADRARSFAEVWNNGGSLMYVLAALSILGLAGIFYFLATIRQGCIAPVAQVQRVRELVKSNRPAEARSLCAAHPTAFASVASVALDFLKDNPKGSPSVVKEIIESEGARQASRLHAMIHYLLDLSSVAPMVGLLGTVVGLLRAFHSVARDQDPVALAGFVGMALATTIAGLVVAIPALIAYAWFRGRVSRLVSSLERASSDLYAAIESARPAEEP